MLVYSMQELLKYVNTLNGTKAKFEPFPNEGKDRKQLSFIKDYFRIR